METRSFWGPALVGSMREIWPIGGGYTSDWKDCIDSHDLKVQVATFKMDDHGFARPWAGVSSLLMETNAQEMLQHSD